MVGYDVITSDEKKVGRVADVHGDNLIVEHGTLLKRKHAIPMTFAHSDESEQVVRVSIPKEIVEASPKIENGSIDRKAIAMHYGLAEGFEAPETEGYGDVVADDPARSAAEQELRSGLDPADAQRARMREEGLEAGNDSVPPSPGVLGGDRYRDASR